MNRALPLLLAAAILAACGDDLPPCKYASYKDLPPAKDGTPAEVVVCQTALDREKGVCFDAAQVCPNTSVLNFCFQPLGTADYYPLTLQLTNYGRAPLTISSIELLGDDRCSFQPLQTSPAVGKAIAPGDSMFVKLNYDPDEGQDFTQLRIRSDAENFPELIVAACGTGIPADDHSKHPCGPPDGFQCQAPANPSVVSCN